MNKISSYEKKVNQILYNAEIYFEREKTFNDCYKGKYRYDFYIPSLNSLIETNGIQHYSYTKHFHKSYSDFTKAQERDRQKIAYALAHKMKIYCIPYWEIENIKSIADLLQAKFLATSKFHNDYVYHQKN